MEDPLEAGADDGDGAFYSPFQAWPSEYPARRLPVNGDGDCDDDPTYPDRYRVLWFCFEPNAVTRSTEIGWRSECWAIRTQEHSCNQQ